MKKLNIDIDGKRSQIELGNLVVDLHAWQQIVMEISTSV